MLSECDKVLGIYLLHKPNKVYISVKLVIPFVEDFQALTERKLKFSFTAKEVKCRLYRISLVVQTHADEEGIA
jgi:hypothetical protein